MVLVQGLALDHHGWDSSIADFADRPVIVFDHRGTGNSDDTFPQSWSTRDFARDVIAVLDAARVDRAHVYGHSMGGRIAQWLGADHPDRVVSLVLGATTVGGDGSVPRSAEASAALAARGSALTALFYPDAWIAEHPAEASSVMPSAASAEAMGHHLAAVALHDGPAPYSIGVPTLVVHGSEDQLAVPENAHLLADGIEGAELLLLPGARHAYWAANSEVHQKVSAFFAQHDGDADDS